MATQNDNQFKSFSFASALSANILVAVSGDNAAAAVTAPKAAIGVLQNDVVAAGIGAVKMFHPTQFGTVSAGPVTAGSAVFAITGGYIAGSLITSAMTLGVAINSGVNGDVVEFAPNFNL